MSPYDLFTLIKNNSLSVTHTIEDVNALINDLHNDMFLEALKDIISEYAMDNNRCSECGERLLQKETWLEDRGEYLGTPSAEMISNYLCINSCKIN